MSPTQLFLWIMLTLFEVSLICLFVFKLEKSNFFSNSKYKYSQKNNQKFKGKDKLFY